MGNIGKKMLDPLGIFTSPPPPPPPQRPATMPDPNDPALIAEQRRKAAVARGNSGRASTVLSPDLGTGNFSKTKL